VVEVQEGGLRPLEEHVLAGFQGLVDQVYGVGDHRLEPGPVAAVAGEDLARRERKAVVDLGQDAVLLPEGQVELGGEDLLVQEVLDPDADPVGLVGVGGPDPPLGGAQLRLAQEPLGHPVQLEVVGHDQVGVAGERQAGRVDSLAGQHVQLGQEHGRVDHHAVADDRGDVGVEDPGGYELECERLPVGDDGVPGVVAALVADHHVHLVGQQVGEATLALVPPLGADDHRPRHRAALRLGIFT
jgi:hypothetical protein